MAIAIGAETRAAMGQILVNLYHHRRDEFWQCFEESQTATTGLALKTALIREEKARIQAEADAAAAAVAGVDIP